MSLEIAVSRFNLTIHDEEIQAIKNSIDSHPISKMLDRVLTKIADWFCGTHRAEAKELLLDLFSENTSNERKYENFARLKELASPAYKDRFKESYLENEDGIEFTLDLGKKSEEIKFSIFFKNVEKPNHAIFPVFDDAQKIYFEYEFFIPPKPQAFSPPQDEYKFEYTFWDPSAK